MGLSGPLTFLFFAPQFADRTGMAVSSFLAAAAASAILLSFAAETRKWHCSGCMGEDGALAVIFSRERLSEGFF